MESRRNGPQLSSRHDDDDDDGNTCIMLAIIMSVSHHDITAVTVCIFHKLPQMVGMRSKVILQCTSLSLISVVLQCKLTSG